MDPTLAAATAAAAASSSVGLNKYSSLPDIDVDGADVFETPEGPVDGSRDDTLETDGSPSLGGTQAIVSEDIDQQGFDSAGAKKRFRAGPGLDGRDADFSGSLRKQNRYPLPRLGLETTEYSLIPRGYSTRDPAAPDEAETPVQRLRRLRFEVQELEEQLEAGEPAEVVGDGDAVAGTKPDRPPAPTTAQLLGQLQLLRRDLAPIATAMGEKEDGGVASKGPLRDRGKEAKALMLRLSEPMPSPLPSSASSSTTPKMARGTDWSTAAAASLDSRLTTLETLLGSTSLLHSSASDSPFPPPVLATLSKLDHQLSLLSQPRHLDSISRRVKALVTDLERVHEARKKLGDSRPLSLALASGITVVSPGSSTTSPSSAIGAGTPITSLPGGPPPPPSTTTTTSLGSTIPPDAVQKLDALSELVPRIDPLLPLVPHLLARLRSLASLHSSASTFANDLSQVKKQVSSLGERGKALAEGLEGVEESLSENERTVKGNLEVVEERVAALVERLDRLAPA